MADYSNQINIGLDVGYFDVKTQNTTTPSGFDKFDTEPFAGEEILHYKGAYYVPSYNRVSHAIDKKLGDTLEILSIEGIAKEILCRFSGNNRKPTQTDIDAVKTVALGVGVPPGNFALEKDSTKEYYEKMFGDGLKFNYKGYEFNLKLNKLFVYPQDFAAATTYRPKDGSKSIAERFDDYVAIDIGGHTVDVVPITGRKPVISGCTSLQMGVLHMYNHIITIVRNETGEDIDMRHAENVLMNRPNCVQDNIVAIIRREAEKWANDILIQLTQLGIKPKLVPTVFIGGGSKLLKNYIDKSSLLGVHEFIPSPNANAYGYSKLNELFFKQEG